MKKKSKIYIAGHNGMVGSAIVRKLKQNGFVNLIFKSSNELDLRNQLAVQNFFKEEQPEFVFLAAAKVGGILANSTYQADFLYDNLAIQNNVIKSAHDVNVKKLQFLGSSCIYPKLASQPLQESSLLSGPLEPTNESYAIAKIAGIKLCESFSDQYGDNFISLMPSNLYGPNDNYDLQNSHVLPALIRKFHEGKVNNSSFVEIWGTGRPLREFLHVDDLADACIFLMKNYNEKLIINVGSGYEISIKKLAVLIKDIVKFRGIIKHDLSKPDGTPRKLLDNSKLKALGWEAKIKLEEGIRAVYNDFLRLEIS